MFGNIFSTQDKLVLRKGDGTIGNIRYTGVYPMKFRVCGGNKAAFAFVCDKLHIFWDISLHTHVPKGFSAVDLS